MGEAKPEINSINVDIEKMLAIAAAIAKRREIVPSTHISDNLPAVDGSHWQGRQREISQLQQWLAHPEIKTIGIHGSEGVGKSWLAAYLYETSHHFEAKFWVSAQANPDFTAFAQKILTHLDGKSPASFASLPSPNLLINELIKSLKHRRCLLVIDNLETLLDSQQYGAGTYKEFFQRWLERGTASKLLLITQIQPESLANRSQWLALSGLHISEGSHLLQSLGIHGTDAELQELASSLNVRPKLLWLVASLLQKTGSPRVKAAENLGLKQLDAALHQPHVKAHRKEIQFLWLLEKHWQQLSPELQEFLANLSLYRHPFTLDAAALVLGKQETPATPLTATLALRELVSRSLLEVVSANQMYQFHPFVWHYVQLHARPHSQRATEKVIAYYQSIAMAKSRWKRLEDIAVYLEIFYQHFQAKQYAIAWETIDACDDFLTYLGCETLRIDIYEKLIKNWEFSNDKKKQIASAIARLAEAYVKIKKYSKAGECCKKALETAKKVGDRKAEAAALHCTSKILYHQKQYQQAIASDNRALKIYQESGDRAKEAAILIHMGQNLYALGNYERAIDFYQEAREVAVSAGSERPEGEARQGLGNVYYSLGQYEPAIEFYQQALVLYREMGDRLNESISLNRLGEAYYALGQYQQAITRIAQSLEIKREIGYFQGIASPLQHLGKAYHALGECDREIKCYEQLLQIQREMGNLPGEAKALEQLWLAHLSLQQHEQALDYHLQLQEIKQKISQAQGEADALEQLGEALDILEQNRHNKLDI